MANPLDLALVVLGILLVITGTLLFARLRGNSRSVPFAPRPLLSPLEASFFAALEEAAGRPWRVLAKVPLDRLVEAAPAVRGRRGRRARERLQGKMIDFILCREEDLQTGVAVSLTGDREQKEVLAEVLGAAGIRLLWFPPLSLPTVEALRQALGSPAGPGTAGTDPAKEEWQLGGLDWLDQDADEWQIGMPAKRPAGGDAPGKAEFLCPDCSSPMARRRMVRGPQAGREFWVCPRYPDCPRLLPVLES